MCQRILRKRMLDECIDTGPIFDIIITLCDALEGPGDSALRCQAYNVLGNPGQPRFDLLEGCWPCQGVANAMSLVVR